MRVDPCAGKPPDPSKRHQAVFGARYVPMLAKWAMTDEEYERAFFSQGRDTSGLQIEPGPEGKGVMLTATNGHRIAQVHDRDGHCDAPVILSLPHEFVDACRPFKGPQAVPAEDGCPYFVKPPEWMSPYRVSLYWEDADARHGGPFWLAYVASAEIPKEARGKGGDECLCFYKSSSNHSSWREAKPSSPDAMRPLVPWSRVLTPPDPPEPVTALSVDTRYLADLMYLGDLAELTFDRATSAIHAQFVDAPEIRAAIMPLKRRTAEERTRDIAQWEADAQRRKLEHMATEGATKQ